RGALEQGDRGTALRIRIHGAEARGQHLRHPAAAAFPGRSPPRPRRRRLPQRVVARTRDGRDYRDMTTAEFTNAHPALASFWHPVALSSEVGPAPVAVLLRGRGGARARFGDGIAAFADACPHRRARLSAGQISDGTLQCPYHGWRFTPDGRCVNIPALEDGAAIPERATLHRPAEVAEQDGMVWLAPEPPRAPLPDLHPGVPLGGDGIATIILPVLRVEAN